MEKLTHVLRLMATPFVLAACTQTAGGPPPGMTPAQGAAYCKKLTWGYGDYVAGVAANGGGVVINFVSMVLPITCSGGMP